MLEKVFRRKSSVQFCLLVVINFFESEVNPCLEEDDGGCHELADCIHTGPGMVSTNPSYSPVIPLLVTECIHSGPGMVSAYQAIPL